MTHSFLLHEHATYTNFCWSGLFEEFTKQVPSSVSVAVLRFRASNFSNARRARQTPSHLIECLYSPSLVIGLESTHFPPHSINIPVSHHVPLIRLFPRIPSVTSSSSSSPEAADKLTRSSESWLMAHVSSGADVSLIEGARFTLKFFATRPCHFGSATGHGRHL